MSKAKKPYRIRQMAVADLAPAPYNPRTIGEPALAGLEQSILRWGCVQPLVWNQRTGELVAGHQRLEVLRRQGVERIEVAVVDLEPAEAKALNVSLNNPHIQGEWDWELLDGLLDEIGKLPGLDAEALGLRSLEDDVAEGLAELLRRAEAMNDGLTDPDAIPDPPPDPITQPGDLWLLGPHRLLCGDWTDVNDLWRLVGQDGKARGLFTSPPYAEQRKDQYAGVPAEEYCAWWETVQAHARETLVPDGSVFVNIKPHCENGQRALYVLDLVAAMVREWGWRFVEEYCWTHVGVPGLYRNRFKNQFEPVYHFALGEVAWRPDNVRIESEAAFEAAGEGPWAQRQGRAPILKGKKAQQGLALPGNVLAFGHATEAFGHPAAFPAKLPGFFVAAFSDEGDRWVDPFLGSGTTLIACEQLGRRCFGMEIEPRYCDVTVRRWEHFTGQTATREGK